MTAGTIAAPAALTLKTAGSERFRLHEGGTVTTGISTVTGVIDAQGYINLAQKIVHTGDTDTSFEFDTNTIKFETAGSERLRITSSGGFQFSNGLFDEKVKITAGKLSDNLNIDLENGMVHYFTTQEDATALPNIRINSGTTLQTAMDTGDVCTVTLITTAAAAGYAANLTIDGNAVTEEWVGGEAPSAGGDDGLDIYCYTIICIGTGTGDSGFKVIANVTNASN